MKFSRYNSISRNGAHALEIALQFPSNGMFCNFNGDGEIRTHDLSDANRTLYQLSYAPKYLLFSIATHISIIDFLQKIKRVAEIFLPENLRHGW